MYDYYASKEWTAIRSAAIEAAGGKCEFCGAPAETAHHVKYPRKMGTEDPRTLVAACWKCHGLMHGKRAEPPDPEFETPVAEALAGEIEDIICTFAPNLRSESTEPAETVKIAAASISAVVLSFITSGVTPSCDAVWDAFEPISSDVIDRLYKEWLAERTAKAR